MQNKKKEYDIEGLGMAQSKAEGMKQPGYEPVGLKLEKQSTPIVPMRADGYQMAMNKANDMKQPAFTPTTLFPMQGAAGNMATAAYNIATGNTNQTVNPNILPDKNIKEYDPEKNYTALMYDAIARGDYGAAKEYERLHNVKNGDMGLGYENSGIFNYIDTKGLGGLKDAKYNELQNHINQGFNYDYEEDPEYKAIRRLKEKESDKAYKDGYAQLSTAFDGDIPVNMINKLISSKNEIVDQADEYIPQLKQMAYNMHMDKTNNLYNQYNMLANEEAMDYNRWLGDRDMFIQGAENAYGRDTYADQTAYNRGRDTIADERYADETAYNRAWNEDDRSYNRAWNEDDRSYNRAWNEDDRNYNRNRDTIADERYADETAYNRMVDEREWKWKTRK